jgi:DNA ligase D-like protein (predicted 3'-phosphoesterase)
VIQEHRSRNLHYDLRLETGGALRSWAVPKPPPRKSGIKRLAVEVEPHDIGYLDFVGSIEDGSYGAGTVKIWDRGTYDIETDRKEKIVFCLHGDRLKGRYTLLRMKWGAGQWIFFKTKREEKLR